jgi:hypothetical protein
LLGPPQIPKEAGVAVTNHLDRKRWAHRLSVLLAVAAFIAALVLIIASITTL